MTDEPEDEPIEAAPQTDAAVIPGGIMPKEALLAVMRHHIGRYEFLTKNPPRPPKKPLAELHRTSLGRYLERVAKWEERVNEVLKQIRDAAKDAAPYYHGKLAPVTVLSAEDIGRIDLDALTDEQLGILLRRVAQALGLHQQQSAGDGGERIAPPARADRDEDRDEEAAAEE